MLSTKTFRPLIFVAAVAFMLVAVTSVQAAPTTPDQLACQVCDDLPECNSECPPGQYCYVNSCTCSAQCKRY
ncbi:MAG: hypothetical protein J3R72DRAFT_447218 [Linnemannia gamsii]|nr:MAG: hypothetical protein J3R72DRAFT_447218 [Linnemannia gamsii]